MTFSREEPYNDLPPLPPGVVLETPRVLKKAIGANKALAELKWAGRQLPNQTILIQAVTLQEAKLSSEIENIVTTHDELYRAFSEIDSKVSPQTKEVLFYRDALWHGTRRIRERPVLGTSLFVEIASIVKGRRLDVRKLPGTRLASEARGTIYTPPSGEDVLRAKLKNLEAFIHDEVELDPLVKLAVMHYQFEAIHPFEDGNGRTGRILNILYLLLMDLLEIPVLYLSRYLIEHKDAYLEGLRRVTEESAWEDWVIFMLEAVQQTATDTRERIEAIVALMEAFQEKIRKEAPSIYTKDLVEQVFQHPYCKIRFLEEAQVAKRQTASTYLRQLEALGLLRGMKVGREVYYINDRLIQALAK